MPYAPSILVVDDDPGIRNYLRRTLTAAGYGVIPVAAAQTALARISQEPPDAIILGTNRLEVTALTTIRAVRSVFAVPVLALLDDGNEAAVVTLLDNGADQCLLKPFSVNEVLAWLRNALRRALHHRPGGRALACGGSEIDIAYGRISRDGQEVRLSRRENQVLRVLAEGDGGVVPYPEIMSSYLGRIQPTQSPLSAVRDPFSQAED